jgi:PHP family Zn ribbon phosphoesterase
MLPEGVFERDGKYFATCRSCERNYELGYYPEEFNSDTNYCGGSPRCLP